MIALSRVGAAAAGPVTLVQAKAHCRVDHNDDDALLAVYLAAATESVSEQVGQVLGLETWAFKAGPVSGDLILPKSPARALTSLSYIAADGQLHEGDTSDFILFADAARPFLRPAPGKAWPFAAPRPDALHVTFTAGLEVVPPALSAAILMLVSHYYENRAAVGSGPHAAMPMAVECLVGLHRVGWAAA